MKEKIERILANAEFTKNVWIGYPAIKDNKVYINARGRDLYVLQNFRDIFGGTANAGSIKTLRYSLHKKEKGFCFVFTKNRMEKILEGLDNQFIIGEEK